MDDAEHEDRKRSLMQHIQMRQPKSGLRDIWEWCISGRILASPMPYVAVLALCVIAGGSVSIAAKDALPGDTLYPVKVSINEELRGYWWYESAESQAFYAARRAQERFDESQALALQNKIDANAMEDISRNLDSHINDIKAFIETQQEKEALAIHSTSSTELATTSSSTRSTQPETGTTSSTAHAGTTTLDTSEASTSTSSTENATESNATSSLTAATTKDHKDHRSTSSSSAVTDATDTIPTTTIKETKQLSEQKLKQLDDHLNGSSTLSAKKERTVKERLQKARAVFQEGMTHLEKKEYKQALSHFTKSQERIESIQAFLKRHDGALFATRDETTTATGTSASASRKNASTSHATTSASGATTTPGQ